MTLSEIVTTYGVLQFSPSDSITLRDAVRFLYGSEDPLYFWVLKELNHREDWWSLSTDMIEYLSKDNIKLLDEVYL